MASEFLTTPKPPPDLNIPPSKNTVKVSCIDSTSRFSIPMPTFLQPSYRGHPDLRGPSFSFLIEHPDPGLHKPILFDLGIRKDWSKLPSYQKFVDLKWQISVERDVASILRANGVDVDAGAIGEIVWSHHHWDHVGDPSTFPGTTGLVVGPGFKAEHLPGWPEREAATLLESDFEGREVREVEFETGGGGGEGGVGKGGGLKIGRFRALDYFRDGSFYLLDTPGHSVGHICGLARTTVGKEGEGDTFVFMGGDAAHHGGEFRPTEFLPLPGGVRLPPGPGREGRWGRGGTCPGHLLRDIHPHGVADRPFYYVTESFAHDKRVADWTIEGLGEFDAHENVLMLMAHDDATVDPARLDFYPKALNDWYEKGVGKALRWAFVEDFGEALEVKEKGGKAFEWGKYP